MAHPVQFLKLRKVRPGARRYSVKMQNVSSDLFYEIGFCRTFTNGELYSR